MEVNMQGVRILLVTMAMFSMRTDALDMSIFTPKFMEMLRKLFESTQIDKSDLSKMAAGAQPSVETEVAVASSTTSTHAPTVAPMANTGESYCDKQSPATFQSYCRDARMRSGVYIDPWDPYCGFIHCDQHGNATRHYCEKGSWTGFKATSHGRQAMCRRPLKLAENGRCTMATFNPQMCRKAEWVVDYNNKVLEA